MLPRRRLPRPLFKLARRYLERLGWVVCTRQQFASRPGSGRMATSPDGLRWTREDITLLADEHGVREVALVHRDGDTLIVPKGA